MTNFDLFHHSDGTINLLQAWRTTADPNLQRFPTQRVKAAQFLRRIEAHQHISSPQVAALALATCQFLIASEKP